ncbi:MULTISPECIES: restriction endonuclease subunit S [unclassified Streptomyces]|uniref:restriction endonuclease subunit S n=1 Tax=unclassified Streptomyces TaxID=2593676 RepID=UPI00341C2A4A
MTSNQLPYGSSPPKYWNVVPLKYLAALSNGYVFKSDGWEDSGTPIIRIENLNGSEDFNYSNLMLSEKHRVNDGDLLFSWSGNPGTSFGPFRWSKAGLWYLNQHIFKLSVHGCDKNWLYWSLKAATHWIERELTSGMIGMVHVTKEELGSVSIPVPPLEEQYRIAGFLDAETARIDQLSAAHKNQISLLAERHLSWLSGLSAQLVNKYGAVRLRHVLAGMEQGWSPQCEDRLAGEGEWGVIKAGCVNGGTFDPLQHKRLPLSVEPRRQYRLRAGDLLMSRASGSTELIGSIGVVPELDRNLLLSDKIYRLRVDRTRARSHFIAHMLRTHPVREHVKLGISGAAGMANNLPTSVVKDCVLPDAPLKEQDSAIVEMRRMGIVVDRTRAALNRQVGLLAERRQALITAAVTGQFDVTTASGRGVDAS